MSAGGIITFVGVILLGGILLVCCGYAIDKVTEYNWNFRSEDQASQIRYDLVTLMIMTFRFEPIVLIIGAGINYLVNSARQFSGEIALGTILFGAAEMILLSLGVIALSLFGGIGIDEAAKWSSLLDITSSAAVAENYFAVQFVGPVIYGVLLLIMFGLVIKFIILCVQTVDYSASYTY